MSKRIAFASLIAMSAIGCSSSSATPSSAIKPEPSGTAGADGGTTSDGGPPILSDGGVSPQTDGGGTPATPGSDPTNASGSRLKARVIVGADGSKQFLGFTDSQLNVNCSFQLASDGTLRCMPTQGAAVGGYFSDPGCGVSLAYEAKGCTPSSYGIQSVYGCGGTSVRIFTGVTPYAGTLYAGAPGACSAFPSSSLPYSLFSVGAELPPSTFVQGTAQLQ